MNTISAKLTQIKVNGENPRSITNDKLNKLVNSILVFPKMLSIRPIVVDDKMVALGGNMRLNALKIIAKMSPEELGTRLATIPDYLKKSAGERENIARHWEEWLKSPVVEIIKASELTEDERKQFIIKDNVSFGTWDYDALANGWDESSLGDWGMDVWQMQPTSFAEQEPPATNTSPSAPSADEIDGDNSSNSVDVVEDDYEEAETIVCRCKRGDIWQLGEHRVMCGDSSNAEDVAALMGGGLADMLLTDPPYGILYVGKTKDALTIKNDSLDEDSLETFLVDTLGIAMQHLENGGAFYIWHADSKGLQFRRAVNTIGLTVRECLIWNKNSLVLGRQDYQWKHEPCLYGWKDGAAHRWYGGRSKTTVIDCNRPTRNGEHPTMKPVALFAELVVNSTLEGDIILDVFGGSGTTLIAAEQLGRKARLMELDEHYCDVIIDRWEKLTGLSAEKIN